MINRSISPWWTVVAGAVSAAAGAGTIMVYAYGILSVPLGAELGWSREILAANMTSFLIGSGLGGLILGWLISRYGIRLPSAILAGLFGLLFAGVAIMPHWPPLFLVVFLLIGIAGTACTALPYAVAISGFFDVRRGLALGIVVAGNGVGATLAPRVANFMVSNYGWRAGFVVIGIGASLICVTALALLVRTPEGVVDRTGAAGRRGTEATSSVLELYVRNRYFWSIAIPILAVSIAAFGGMTSLVRLFRDHEIDAATIASALSFAGLCSWFGRIAVGYVLDKVFAPIVCAITFGVAATGLLLLVGVNGTVVVYAASGMVAIALGAEADLISYLISRYFRLVDYSRVLGVMWVVWAWGGGLGTFLSESSRGTFGSYAPAYCLFVAMLAVGAFTICRIGPYLNAVHGAGADVAAASEARQDDAAVRPA